MFLTQFKPIVYVFATIYMNVNDLWGRRSKSLCMLYSRKKPLYITFFGSEGIPSDPELCNLLVAPPLHILRNCYIYYSSVASCCDLMNVVFDTTYTSFLY